MTEVKDLSRFDPQELLFAVLDAIPDVIGIQDRRHVVLRYNKAGYEWLKTTPEEGAGRRCFEHIGRTRPCEECATSQALRTGRPARIVKYVPEWDKWYEVRAYPLLTRGGKEPQLVIEHLRDITEEKLLQERLRQSEKMETIGRLSGGVAHDLNNLLQPILGYTEIALSGMSAEHPQREPLKVILDAAQRSRDIIRKLLAFARRQVLQVEVHEIDSLVADLKHLLRHMLREDVRLELSCGAPGARVKADRAQFEQVLLNLALNAQDALPNGGTVSISTAPVLVEAGHAHLSPGPYVRVEVRDTGLGIPTAILSRIFEPFFTTKEPGKGTGLGLATVYGTVRQHGGSIEVQSEPGQGSVFTIHFPATQEVPQQRAVVIPLPVVDAPTRQILVVEDDPSVRRLTCTFLRLAGYRVAEADGGAAALAAIDAMGDSRLDLLLSDVVLSDTNGVSLYHEIRRRQPGCRVLFMSGYADNMIEHHGLQNISVRLIEKPFSRDALLDAVRATLTE
ncbi:MAG: response regulator [Myxococcales bacterium]|nr:response regulator [Myxococcales bacterium]